MLANSKLEVLSLDDCLRVLKPRPENSHKNLFGHVLVIGGDYGMAGATILAGLGALRVGAGSVTIATRPEHAAQLSSFSPELMSLAVESFQNLENILTRTTTIIFGPGLGQKKWGLNLFQSLMEMNLEQPFIMDADALNLLSSRPESRENWILTPHPGEASRLLGCTTESIQKDRLQSIKELRKRYHGTIVLKGKGTLILGFDERPKICEQGNPGMSTAGMGDVLSGMIAGLVAQGLSPLEASTLAVVAHAEAGDRAQKAIGDRGIIASDVLRIIPRCLSREH